MRLIFHLFCFNNALQVDIADMERRLFRPLYVESWFSADIKLGALALNLEPPKCFAAECYARE
jgi:hypothetical protein